MNPDLSLARRLLQLGEYEEAWHAVENLPASRRREDDAVAVRLLAAVGMENWTVAEALAGSLSDADVQGHSQLAAEGAAIQEAVSYFRLAYADALRRAGDVGPAALQSAHSIFPTPAANKAPGEEHSTNPVQPMPFRKIYRLKEVESAWTLYDDGSRRPVISTTEKEDAIDATLQFMQKNRGTLIVEQPTGEIEEYNIPGPRLRLAGANLPE